MPPQVTLRHSPKTASFVARIVVKSCRRRACDRLGDLGDLPVWRELLLSCCVGVWSFFGVRHFFQEVDIYTSAPQTPVIKTKQLYPVHVNHGYLRYVTKEEAEKWEYSNSTTGPIIGATALTMLLLLGTFRYPRSNWKAHGWRKQAISQEPSTVEESSGAAGNAQSSD